MKALRRWSRAVGALGRRVPLVVLVPFVAGCAARAASGPPLEDPAGAAGRLSAASIPDSPAHLRFHWEYADERGPTRGDGVARFNPPDSLRLDLFGPGDASLAVALTGDSLRSLGQLRNVKLPPPPYLYATAGLFEPGAGLPARGYKSQGDVVLVYDVPNDVQRRYVVRGGRLIRVEDDRGGRTLRRLEISWPDTASRWPEGAEYRDRVEESRARWTLKEATSVDEPYPASIFDLPYGG